MLTSRPLQITAMICSGRILHPERDGGADKSPFRQVRPAVVARSTVLIEIVALTGFSHSLHVKPETVIRRQRQSFRLYWHWKSRHTGRSDAGREVGELVQKMCVSSAGWGARRIHGELLRLGIDVSQTTVSKHMVRRRKPPSQTWRVFLDNYF